MAQRQDLPQPQNAEQLAQVLGMLAGHATDNDQIQQATAILKIFLKQPSCVAPLMEQIKSSADPGIRQMAAVLLRRKIASHILKVPENLQAEIKATLFDRLVVEDMRPVRLGVAALISKLAQKMIRLNKWNLDELLQFLLQCSQSQQAGHREVAMLLFRFLAENIGEPLKKHFNTLQGIFTQGLSDPESGVRLEALKAIGVLAEESPLESEAEIASFSSVIPLMCNAVKQSVQQGNEEAAAVTFEAFDDLAERGNVLVPHLAMVLELMAEVTSNTSIDMNIRDKASFFIASVCENKPGKLVKLNLVAPLVNMCFQLAVEPFESDSFEASEMTPQKIAIEILDALALNTPKQFIYDSCINRMMGLLNEANPNMRKGALVILAVLAEGLAELLKPNLEQLLQIIIKSLQDQSSLVRSSAAVCITQFSDYLQPEVLDCHQMVMPCLFSVLDSPREESGVKARACTALDSFCERLGPEIQPYIQPLMERLVAVLKTSTQDQQAQESIIHAIKSVAKSAEEAFSPFFHDTIQLMAQLMNRQEDEMLGLRSAATECVGAIACAVGKEKFAPFLEDAIRLAVNGMALQHFQLREATHNFFQSLCVMLGTEFATRLPLVMPLLLASCQSDDGLVVEGGDKNEFGGPSPYEELSDPDEDDEDFGKGYRFMIRSGALDEKLAAVGCIGTIASVVGENFMPFLQKTIEALEEISMYPHHYIRSNVLQAFAEIIGLMHTVYPNAEQWRIGHPVPLKAETQMVISKLLPIIVERMTEEDEKSVVASACAALFDACKKFGPAVVELPISVDGQQPKPLINDINEAILVLVNEKAPCQMAYEDDDPERADHDEVLIDDVTNCLGVFAQMYGPQYDAAFSQLFPALMKFCPDHRPCHDRSMAIGCIAEVAESIGEGIVKYLEAVFPVVIKGLSDSAVEVRRNSAFCLGALCFASGPALHPHYAQCLTALQPILTVDPNCSKYEREQIVATKDNAASVLAKMIVSNPSAVPLDQVVPVLLGACPLEADFEEAKHVYPVIVQLFSSHTQLMLSHLGPAVNAVAGALHMQDMLEAETRNQLIQFCKALPQAAGGNLEAVTNSLSPERKQAFIGAINFNG